MATGSSTPNDHGLVVLPRCADPGWVALHGSPTVDIVAIHGLNGGRWSTWTYKAKGKTDVMWLQDLLPDKLPQARVMTFGYNADMINNYSTSNIRDHARKLLSMLRNKRDEGDQATRPIVFVCHSLGGIVAKQALRIATNETPYNSIANCTRGIVFMGTPHRGSDLAFWGKILASIAKAAFLHPTKNITELQNNSSTLMDVSEDFRSIVGKYSIVSFYEDTKIKGVSKEVVGKHSAVMEITGEEAIPLAGNHMEICKFSGVDDERFEEVWKAIKRLIESNPDQISKAKRELMQRLTRLAQFDHQRFLEKMPSPLEGTCSWVLEHSAYRSWLNGSGASMLHIVGKTGCGKSMISKYLLENSKSQLAWIGSGYFSFSATEGRQYLIQVYSSFLLQILAFAPSMYPRIIEACSACPKGDWDETDLETLLEEALCIFPHRCVILILDSLDECAGFGSDVLVAISGICHKAPWCKVLMTSRPNEGMPREDGVSELNLDKEAGLEADIRLFIENRVGLLLKAHPFVQPLKAEITKRLNERADGMFLLVEHIHRSLVNLKGTSRKIIRQVLDSLPKTLEDAYAQTFDRVDPEDIEFARITLICLLYPARPMNVSELAIAIAVTEETRSFTEMSENIALSILYEINARIGPIITVTNTTVSLIHASLKDFLLSTVDNCSVEAIESTQDHMGSSRKNTQKWYKIRKSEANDILLSRCMKYLNISFQWTLKNPTSISLLQQAVNIEKRESLETTVSECVGFLAYAVESIPDHVRMLSKTAWTLRTGVELFFGVESKQFPWWRSSYWTLRDPSRIEEKLSPLAMACLLGLKLTVKDLLVTTRRYIFESHLEKALEVAIEGGSYEVVKLLIESGVNVNAMVKETEARTMLSAAVWYGRIDIIELLLATSRKLDLWKEEMNGYISIDVAVAAGQQTTVRWLHAKGAPLNLGNEFWDKRKFSALHVAALSNRSGMIPMLIELGADVKERSRIGDLAFHTAAAAGNLKALQILKPSNIDERGANGDTALLRAARFLQKEAILYLLNEGANINARSSTQDFGTALHLAVEGEKRHDHQRTKDVVELLLRCGINIPKEESCLDRWFSALCASNNVLTLSFLLEWPGLLPSSKAHDPEFWSDLWRVSYGSSAFEVCKYLLQTQKIDVETRDSNGNTALHVAARDTQVAFCQKLVSEYKADTTSQDGNGRTPLFHTIHFYIKIPERLEIARIFIQSNSQILHIADKDGLTALHLAAEEGSVQMARLFLESGAAVDATDAKGRTPLICCRYYRYYEETSIFLLQEGANPLLRPTTGPSFAMCAADAGHDKIMEVILQMGYHFTENDVLETIQHGTSSETRVSCLLWYTCLDGNIKLAQNMLNNGMISSTDRQRGIKFALKKAESSIIELLATALEKDVVEEIMGIELATLLTDSVSPERSKAIVFILRFDYVDLNRSYLPRREGDWREVPRRSALNLLVEAAGRGEHDFVKAMLEKQTSRQISSEVLDTAIRRAKKKNHLSVVRELRAARLHLAPP
ncbi:ankyrin [Hyaloscypha variabilis]